MKLVRFCASSRVRGLSGASVPSPRWPHISKIPSHYPGLPEGYPARVAEFRVPSSEKPKSWFFLLRHIILARDCPKVLRERHVIIRVSCQKHNFFWSGVVLQTAGMEEEAGNILIDNLYK
jgi:hypothetical protein